MSQQIAVVLWMLSPLNPPAQGSVRYTLSESGMVAFVSALTGPDVNESNNYGLWATDPTGELRLILREGDPFEVASGDWRTVGAIGLGEANERWQLTFLAGFGAGSQGIFIAQVPEPVPGALLALVALRALLHRRRSA